MRLIEVLERQAGYLIFIRSNCVSFYKVQCAIFAKLFSILILYWHTLFPVGKCLYEIPDFSRSWEPCVTINNTVSNKLNNSFAQKNMQSLGLLPTEQSNQQDYCLRTCATAILLLYYYPLPQLP